MIQGTTIDSFSHIQYNIRYIIPQIRSVKIKWTIFRLSILVLL